MMIKDAEIEGTGKFSTDHGSKSANLSTRRVLSVHTKSMLVFVALVTYTFLVAFFIFQEKQRLLHEFEAIEKSWQIDSAVRQADVAASHALMGVVANLEASDPVAGMQRVRTHYLLLRSRYVALKAHHPSVKINLDAVNTAMEDATIDPSKAGMHQLIAELLKTKNEFNVLEERSQRVREGMSDRYRKQSNMVALTALLLGVLGFVALGATAGLFFKRLTRDLRVLQLRALDIVSGYRGEPLPVRRRDEVGLLMMAVNGMATDLDNREKELLLERQKYFHQEKMAAVGALAAGVAHEIGNPIAAISGIAQDISNRRAERLGDSHANACAQCRPDLILEQTQRLAAITREISDFASPQPAEPQLLDLNAQLRSTSSLIRYDKRMRRVDLRMELDSQLPAIYGVADQLTQLIMNLLINAMDALEQVMDRPPIIVISSRVDGSRVCLTVEDNGPGMEKEVLERAFEAFYTTKPAGKGTGLGLSLCHSIMKRHEGSIEIGSTPGAGTRVRAFFPMKEIS